MKTDGKNIFWKQKEMPGLLGMETVLMKNINPKEHNF